MSDFEDAVLAMEEGRLSSYAADWLMWTFRLPPDELAKRVEDADCKVMMHAFERNRIALRGMLRDIDLNQSEWLDEVPDDAALIERGRVAAWMWQDEWLRRVYAQYPDWDARTNKALG